MSTASTQSTPQAAKLYDCRDAYSKALEAMAENDPRVCAVVSDSVSSTKLKYFSQKFPARFVNVGIAEQNMVGVGAGLANGGMIPYVCAASCFITARAMEQVKVDLGYSNSNVRCAACRPAWRMENSVRPITPSKTSPGRVSFRISR